MKYLMMVLMVCLMGCEVKGADTVSVGDITIDYGGGVIDDHCSKDNTFSIVDQGIANLYTFTVNECNAIESVSAYKDSYLSDNINSPLVFTLTTRFDVLNDDTDDLVSVMYRKEFFEFRYKTAFFIINGGNKIPTYINYTYNYGDDFITTVSESQGDQIDFIYSHEESYINIMNNVSPVNVIAQLDEALKTIN